MRLITRSRWSWVLFALPFAMIVVIVGLREALGTGWGVLPLLAVAPAFAAAVGGVRYILAVAAPALAVCMYFLAASPSGSAASHRAIIATVAVVGVTSAGCLASAFRTRGQRELARVRLVADATQKVVLRPVPREAGPVRFAARYMSASEEARVGGDLYEVVSTPDWVRFVVGDAEGKGLPVLRSASAVLGAFREAAYQERSLVAVASRIEESLARQLSPEEYVTAILAEVSPDGTGMELLNCGHPAPLLLGSSEPTFITLPQGSLPLGLGDLPGEPRRTVTVPLATGDRVLFYTDGIIEARNRAGEFFPLLGSDSLRSRQPADSLLEQLSEEMVKFVGHPPADDVALLLVYRDGG